MFAIEVENLQFGYKEKIIDDISFKIKEGQFVSLIGPNGSGKSTIIKLLNHIYSPWKGKILIDNKDINSFSKKELARKISLVPQNTLIDYDFTVEDIVLMGRYPYKKRFERYDEKDYEAVHRALKATNTFHIKGKIITEISGGERQRVIIAKALAQGTPIILLDEPTSHLDLNHQMEILNLLKKLNEEKKTTIIIAIHDINLASRYSDEIIILNMGKVIDNGVPEKVITKENMEKVYGVKVAIEKNKHTNSLSITPISN
ncbi:MAG: ABC transporter ATP-binding protein [Tissierellia bacterium]|nr:ABC transporter ATP-binding protein [Tissierellia bacterium]